MTKQLATIAALAILAGCKTSGPSIQAVREYNESGQLIADRSGQSQATAGAVNDTTDKEIIVALSDKITAGTPFTYSGAIRSGIAQPDIQRETELEEQRKEALKDAEQAIAAGVTGGYSAAIAKAADLGAKILEIREARKNKPDPDSSLIIARTLSVGPDHAQVPLEGVKTFGQTIQSKTRAGYTSSDSRSFTDNTTEAEYLGLVGAVESAVNAHTQAITERKIKALEAETERLKNISPAAGSQSNQNQKENGSLFDTDTPAAGVFSGTPESRARIWYPDAIWGGHNEAQRSGKQDPVNNTFLWKPVGDGGTSAKLLIPANINTASVETLGKVFRPPWKLSNGYRPTIDLGRKSPPGSHTVKINTAEGKVISVSVPDGTKRTERKLDYSSPDPADTTPDLQPEPAPDIPENVNAMNWTTGTLYLSRTLSGAVIRTPKFESIDGPEVGQAVGPTSGNMRDGRPRSLAGVYQFQNADPAKTWAGIVVNIPQGLYSGIPDPPSTVERNKPEGEDTLIIRPGA